MKFQIRERPEPMIVVLGEQELPGSFDVVWQIQNMLGIATVNNYERPKVLFHFDTFNPPPVFGHKVFLDNVIRPLMRMYGIEELDRSQYLIKTEHSTVYRIPQGKLFTSMPFNMATFVNLYETKGIRPFAYEVSEYAKEWANNYRDVVTMTIRQCDYYTERNSNISEWFKAAEVLRGRQEKVVFVPDTYNLTLDVNGFEVISDAALDIEKRAALYKAAKANLFIANGPGGLCSSTTDIPYLFIITPDGREFFPYKKWTGVDKGEAGPSFRGNRQLWVWDYDTCENIINGYERIIKGDCV
jgi:hypothetical protein